MAPKQARNRDLFRGLKRPLLVLVGLSVLFYSVLLFQLPSLYEDGIYAHYTSSILEDGDFNIVNQRVGDPLNWQVTETGNDNSFKPVGISVFLAPFFAYGYALDWVTGTYDRGNRLRFLSVNVLASVFYVLCGIIALWRTLVFLKIPHFRKALLIGAVSTSLIYYFFVEATAPNIFSLAYSALAFSYFALLDPGKTRVGRIEMAILGLAFGLGVAIRVDHLWIGVLPLVLLLGGRRIGRNGFVAFLGGASFPLALMLLNGSLRAAGSAGLAAPYLVFHRNSLPLSWSAFVYELVGPNGYLAISPIYLLAALALPWVLARRFPNPLGRSFWAVLAVPVALVLAYASLGTVLEGLAGRHLISFYFLLVLLLAGGLRELEKRSPAWLIAGLSAAAIASAWNLFLVLCYFHGGSTTIQWTTGGQATLANAWLGIDYFWQRISADAFRDLRVVVTHLPLLAVLVPVPLYLMSASSERLRAAIGRFFLLGGGIFLLFTALNLSHHRANVERYRREGLYADKVVGQGRTIADYDGRIEAAHLTIAYFLKIGRCDLAGMKNTQLREYLEATKNGVQADPTGFVRGLEEGMIRASAYDAPGTFEMLRQELQSQCGFSLAYQGYRPVR